MATLRALILVSLLAPLQTVFAEPGESSAAPPEFPLVVRIDDQALDPLRAKEILHEGAVDRVVLGTRAVGRSWTTGTVDVEMTPGRDDASFTIRFRGRAQTQTTGRNGPALIYSRTFTDFECARRVVIEPRIGLVVGPTIIKSQTSLVYDGFASSRGGLGKRLVARVAQRRAGESYDQARAIAQRDNEAAIRKAFDKRLDNKLVAINRRLDIARYVNALFGPNSKPHLATRSCQDCILIGIGNEESPRRLVTLPPQREKTTPIELWVHSSLLGERMARLATIMDRVDSKLLPAASRFQVLQLMLGSGQMQQPFDVGYQDGWLVIGLQNEIPEPGTLALLMAVEYAARRLPAVPVASIARIAAAEPVTPPPGSSGGR